MPRAATAPGMTAGATKAPRARPRPATVLYAVAEALNSAPDVRQALERTLALVADLLGLPTGWVWLLDPETNQFYNAAARNLPPYLREPVRMAGHWCECIGAFRDGELRPRNVDVIECSRLLPAVRANDTALTQGLRFHASVPLYFQEKPLGIMNLTGPAWGKLTREELRLLAAIASQVGVAVERARLAEESTRLARAEERARLAREIHDTLAQGLTAIGLHVESAMRALDKDPARARERLERALATTRESLEEARQSVLDLRAVPLAGRPLGEALAALARRFTTETGVRVHVRASHGPGEPPPLPLRYEAELYRIAQEALANVRQHARAQNVEVRLRLTPRTIRLAIQDDGQGFAPTGRGASGAASAWSGGENGHISGQGIQGMRERARLLGGRLQLASKPGRGVTVVVAVPQPEAEGVP